MSTTPGIDHSQAFHSVTGINLHGTGAVTRDHELERQKQLQAIQCMHRRDVLDVDTLSMLFAPPNETTFTTGSNSGRQPKHRADATERIQAAIDRAVGDLA